MGVVAAVGTALGAAASIKGQRDQRKAAKKQNRIAERRENIQASRNRIAAIRSQRMAQAQALNAGAVSGTGDSSAIQGTVAGIGTGTAGNISFANKMDQLANQSLQVQESLADRQQLTGYTQLVGSVMTSVGQNVAARRENAALQEQIDQTNSGKV